MARMVPTNRLIGLIISIVLLITFIVLWNFPPPGTKKIVRKLKQTIQPSLPIDTEWRRSFVNFLERNELARNRSIEKRVNALRSGSEISGADIWTLYPPDFTCPHITERIGGIGQGGKWICGLNIFEETGDPCIVYIIGLDKEDSFEEEILNRTSCIIHAFDRHAKIGDLGVGNDPRIAARFQLTPLSLGKPLKKDFRTLNQLMVENDVLWLDFVKMELGIDDFSNLLEFSKNFGNVLPIGHLNLAVIINFGAGEEPKALLKKFDSLWQSLEAKGLRAFAWENNNLQYGVMEYSFINVKAVKNRLTQF